MNARTDILRRRLGDLLLTRGAAADWRRLRVLKMLLTTVLVSWGTWHVLGALVDATRPVSGARAQDLIAEVVVEAPEDSAARGTAGDDLRDDLFSVPVDRPRVEREPPRTNPAELLALIELQGVIGGARPRAMVHFRQNQETVTVSAGDDLGQFEVIEIRERSVVLRWRDELFELSL